MIKPYFLPKYVKGFFWYFTSIYHSYLLFLQIICKANFLKYILSIFLKLQFSSWAARRMKVKTKKQILTQKIWLSRKYLFFYFLLSGKKKKAWQNTYFKKTVFFKLLFKSLSHFITDSNKDVFAYIFDLKTTWA